MTEINSSKTVALDHQLEQIVDESPVVAFVWSLTEGWPVEFVSHAIERFGFQREEFLSGRLHYAEIVHPDDLDRVGEKFQHHLDSGPDRLYQRYRIVTKSGEVLWVDDWTRIVRDEEGVATEARGVILDVTEIVTSAQRAHRYLEVTGTIFLYLDLDGRVVDTNEQTCLLTRRHREDLIGVNWIEQFVPSDTRLEIEGVSDEIFGERFNGPGEYVNEIEVDGERLMIRWHFVLDRGHEEKPVGMICFGHDITIMRELVVQADRLADVAQSMSGALFDYDRKTNGEDRVFFMNEYCEQLWEVGPDEIQNDTTALWKKIDTRDVPGLVESIEDSARFLSELNMQWRIHTPSGKVKWIHGRAQPRRLADDEIRWTTVAVDITESKKASEAKITALEKSVFALAAVLEARDPYTAGHEAKVSEISVKIARRLGQPDKEIEGLELAAKIHDIGKISIPSEILSKPTPLTDLEFDLIKDHSMKGADFIRDIDFEWPVAAIIEQHHERLDGSGYPKGLAGDEILLEARIIGVADTLEAMAAYRPYRPGLGIEAAIEVLEEGSGTLYEAEVVRVCISMLRTGDISFS